MSSPPIIEVQGLVKQYGDPADASGVRAVDGLTFRVERGEVFGLLGPNGAGKTSAIRMIYGFLPRSGGSLMVFGQDIATRWRQIRQRVGVCQQDNTLDPDLSVAENLVVFASYFGIPATTSRARADELLEFFALDKKREAKVAELSGGMARRLTLARALINDPELLILDEPTTGLDPQSRHQLWERLLDLKARGLTILLTTHYMEEAARLCDRLVIVDHGKVLVEGTPEALVLSHAGQAIIEIDSTDPALREFLRQEQADFEDLGQRVIVYDCGQEHDDPLAERLRRQFCRGGCVFRAATLEDVFLRLTGRELRE